MAKLRVAQELIDFFYPVGCIYTSMNSTSPQTLFGGTWVQIKDRFLYCTTTSKTTGGASSISYTPAGSISGTVAGHALIESEIPRHRHSGIYWAFGSAPLGLDKSGQGFTLSGGWTGSSSDGDGKMCTGYTGGGGSHNHGFSGSFSGTSSSIATMPPWISCYAWYRTA